MKGEDFELLLTRLDEFSESKYIIADIKIVNLLKAVAQSETLLEIFKESLEDFDFNKAIKTYLVSDEINNGAGKFILPPNTKEILAFIFTLLIKIDNKEIILNDLLKKYFFEATFVGSYARFLEEMVKPFRSAVIKIYESVKAGSENPILDVSTKEARQKKETAESSEKTTKQKEQAQKTYNESLALAKQNLLNDKINIKNSNLKSEDKEELTLVVDMLANVIDSNDKDSIKYAYTAYKYVVISRKKIFRKRRKVMEQLIKVILNV